MNMKKETARNIVEQLSQYGKLFINADTGLLQETEAWEQEEYAFLQTVQQQIYQKKLSLNAVSFLEMLSEGHGIPREVSSPALSLAQGLGADLYENLVLNNIESECDLNTKTAKVRNIVEQSIQYLKDFINADTDLLQETEAWEQEEYALLQTVRQQIYQKKLSLNAVSFLEMLSEGHGIPREVSSPTLSLAQGLGADLYENLVLNDIESECAVCHMNTATVRNIVKQSNQYWKDFINADTNLLQEAEAWEQEEYAFLQTVRQQIYQKKLSLNAVSFLEMLSKGHGIPREVSSPTLSLAQGLGADLYQSPVLNDIESEDVSQTNATKSPPNGQDGKKKKNEEMKDKAIKNIRQPEAPHLFYESKLRYPQSVSKGETFGIHVNIHGYPAPEITWLHNDGPLTNGNGVTIQTTEQYSKLEITNMKDEDFGKYVVQATNSSGFFTANYEVRKSSVHADPGLTDPSQDLNPPDTFGVHVTNKKTVIQHPQSSIILTVPGGAVAEGETCTITGQVHTDLHNYQHLLEPEHYFITPIVEYEASSHILQPVEIRMPHCLNGQDLGVEMNIKVYILHEEKKEGITKEANEAYSFKVEGDEIIIQTKKFGRFYCEGSGIPSAFPVRLDLWMTHKLYTTHHVVTLQPVLRLGLALQKDFDFLKARDPYLRSKLIKTQYANGIGQQLVIDSFWKQTKNSWKEWESSANIELNVAVLHLKAPWSYITLLPETCLSSKTGGQLKGSLNINLCDPVSSRHAQIPLSVEEDVTSSDYTDCPPQLLYPPSYKQSHMIKKGEDLRLELKLAGKPLPEVSWFHNDVEVQNDGNISIQKSETHTVLEIRGALLSDAGCYQIKASNYLGYIETKTQVLVYQSQEDQEKLFANQFHKRDPDVFGVQIRSQETTFLQHPRSSIILTVPKGACPVNSDLQKYTVSGQVDTDPNAFSHLLEPEHCFIAQPIQYKTNIEQFLTPVEIKVPHCLAPGQDKKYVKVFCTKMDGKKAIKKQLKQDYEYTFDDKFIKITTTHFCTIHCQAHQEKCTFISLVCLYMFSTETQHLERQKRTIKLQPVSRIGCYDNRDFEDELRTVVHPEMKLIDRKPLNLPGKLRCRKARTELETDMTNIEFLCSGHIKEEPVSLTKIRLPMLNGLPDYALQVPLEAPCLSAKLQIVLVNETGEDPHTTFFLEENLEQVTDAVAPSDGRATLTGDWSYLAKKIMDGLRDHRVAFIEKSDYSDTFSDHLMQYEVIQHYMHTELNEFQPHQRMRELVACLPKRPEESKLWFARALIETGQQFILEEELGLTEAEIKDIKSMAKSHSDIWSPNSEKNQLQQVRCHYQKKITKVAPSQTTISQTSPAQIASRKPAVPSVGQESTRGKHSRKRRECKDKCKCKCKCLLL